MEIDWKAAPKGSEKYNPTNGLFYRGRRPNLKVWFNDGWEESTLLPQNEIFSERPPLTVADLNLESPTLHLQWCGRIERKWSGDGLPPIGTECEAKNRMNDTWYRVKVIDHQGSVNSAVCREICTDKLWWSDSFRPVKTAEEIAAEAEEAAIKQMTSELFAQPEDLTGLRDICSALYRIGYRKAAQ